MRIVSLRSPSIGGNWATAACISPAASRGQVRGGEDAHDTVADGFDHPPVNVSVMPEQGEDHPHLAEGGGVAQRLVKASAVAHVGEQHCHACLLPCHL